MTEDTLLVTTRQEWRAWLETHGIERDDIWLIYFKKHTGKPTIAYEDAVQEAICFGWIDTTVRRIDDQRYQQRFARRRRKSKWSATNRRRAEALLAEGVVRDEGLACIEEAKENGAWEEANSDKANLETPEELEKALTANKKAAVFFEGLPPGQKKEILGWVRQAKKTVTRQRRATEAVRLLAAGKKLGMK